MQRLGSPADNAEGSADETSAPTKSLLDDVDHVSRELVEALDGKRESALAMWQGIAVFWLFWSRRAAASQWVHWELKTALASKAADAIVPMPLEDPAIAPPPDELAHEHFRDRYLVAGLAMAHIAQHIDR